MTTVWSRQWLLCGRHPHHMRSHDGDFVNVCIANAIHTYTQKRQSRQHQTNNSVMEIRWNPFRFVQFTKQQFHNSPGSKSQSSYPYCYIEISVQQLKCTKRNLDIDIAEHFHFVISFITYTLNSDMRDAHLRNRLRYYSTTNVLCVLFFYYYSKARDCCRF